MPTFIETHQASKMICKVRSLKSPIKTCSGLEENTTSNYEGFKDFVSDRAVGIRKLHNPTRETTESNVTVKQTPDS